MFRQFVKYIDTQQFLRDLIGHELPALGDKIICNRPISLFIDTIPEPGKLDYNENNILFLYQPDEISSMHKWTLENGHLFSCILSPYDDICEKWDTGCKFDRLPYLDMIGKLKEFLYEIIEMNNIEESRYWSQEMEDKWIDENLELTDKGFFLDIGACHAKIISNTYFFEKIKGWNGLGIEPDPVYFEDLKNNRKCYLERVAISPVHKKAWYKPKNGIVEIKEDDSIEIDCVRLDYLLDKYKIEKIDLISIDIEGYEEVAWSTFDYKKYNPKVIIVEHTEFGRYDDSFAKKILKDTNYYIAHTTPLNFILVNKNVKRK